VRNPKQTRKDPEAGRCLCPKQTILPSCNYRFTKQISSFLIFVYIYVHIFSVVYPLTTIFNVCTLLRYRKLNLILYGYSQSFIRILLLSSRTKDLGEVCMGQKRPNCIDRMFLCHRQMSSEIFNQTMYKM
jgi:hypothetical protein